MSNPLLSRIRSSQRTIERLWEFCEFTPAEGETPDWFRLEPEAPLEVVGRDGSGGCFCLAGDGSDAARRLLYVSSEGQAGSIASSLAEGLALMIAFPYWRDCLAFSGGGDLDAMRRAGQLLESDLRRAHPDLDAQRQELYAGLELTEPDAPLEGLLRSLQDDAGYLVVAARDGYPFEGLLGADRM